HTHTHRHTERDRPPPSPRGLSLIPDSKSCGPSPTCSEYYRPSLMGNVTLTATVIVCVEITPPNKLCQTALSIRRLSTAEPQAQPDLSMTKHTHTHTHTHKHTHTHNC